MTPTPPLYIRFLRFRALKDYNLPFIVMDISYRVGTASAPPLPSCYLLLSPPPPPAPFLSPSLLLHLSSSLSPPLTLRAGKPLDALASKRIKMLRAAGN
eukprot:768226-Hanusia_phi.AAC.1